MNEQDFYPESSRSLDSLRHMRLMALLWDMIEAEGKVQTAAALDVNYRTLVRHEETGRLTDRMADALERLGCRPAAGSGRCVGGAGVRFGAGAAWRPRSRRGRGQGVQGGARKVDAARGAAAGTAGGGKERV